MNRLDIYVDMLSISLPYIRGVQSHGFIRKIIDKSCYYEAELLHNIVGSLRKSNFCSWDIYFLNNQAKFYLENANEKICPNYTAHKENIKKLFNMVPDNRKRELSWSGPK